MYVDALFGLDLDDEDVGGSRREDSRGRGFELNADFCFGFVES